MLTLPGANLFAMQRNPLAYLTRVVREQSDVAHFKLAFRDYFVFNEPDLVREVLVVKNAAFMKGRGLQRAKAFLGEGLLTSEGEFHRRQRRLAQAAFHRERINGYGRTMVGYAARTSERWRDGQTIDARNAMAQLTLAIAAKTLFDADVEGEADEIGSALGELLGRFNIAFVAFDFLNRLPLPSTLRFRRASARLDQTIYRIIEERRRSREDRGDLMSMLLMARDEEEGTGGMTDLQVRDEAMTLMLAGHETTANALTWTWYLLSKHPDVERRLHEEIDAVLGERLPSPEDVPRLRYCEMVFAESMRLYPPAWIIGRMALEDVEIGPCRMRPRSIAVVSPYLMHHNARYFPDPETFDPQRFAPEAKASRPKFAYFPFGGGQRVCIGEGFAWMEGVLLIATLAQRWRMESLSERPIPLQPVITLRPRAGVPMRLVSRKR
jgi:cytochrome P450